MLESEKESFSIRSEVNHVTITINEVYGFPETTFFMGGYDAVCQIEVLSHQFSANGLVYMSTAQFHEFYTKLTQANQTLKGNAHFGAYENNFFTELTFDGLGHIAIRGSYDDQGNELNFYFETDQTFVAGTLNELSPIVDKYGDNLGNKNLRTT